MPTKRYSLVAKTTITATGTSSVTFSSLGSYTDLRIIFRGTVADLADLALRFNSDTGSNYSSTHISATGSGAANNRQSGSFMWLDTYAGLRVVDFSLHIIDILSYRSTNIYKNALVLSAAASSGADISVGTWRNTNAITSITFFPYGTYDFAVGSTFSIYGIEAS